MKQPRYFWLKSDNKTVKEISFEEWRRMVNQDCKRKNFARKLIRVYDTEIYMRKGLRFMYFHRNQLEEILKLCEARNPKK